MFPTEGWDHRGTRLACFNNWCHLQPQSELLGTPFVFGFFFLFFSTFYFNFMKLCYIALLMTPIMTGINNLCPVIIVK